MAHATPLPPPLRQRLADLVAREGERLTVARLGLSRHTVARILGGLGVHAATAALVRQRLDALDAATTRLPADDVDAR